MTEGLVAQLKQRWPILEIVELIGLAEGRKGTKILCPGHADTDPSCHLYVDQDRFQCFVCDAGGDQLDLFALSQGLPLADAIAALATEAGLDHRQDWGTTKRPPSLAQQLLGVEAKAQLEVLRALSRDYPEFHGREAWCSLVEAAFWHHDEVMRRYRNRELQPETAIELLLTWWKWMTGGRAYKRDMLTLLSVIGDARSWTEITGKPPIPEGESNGQQEQGSGDPGRGAGGDDAAPRRAQGVAAAQPRNQGPGRRRSLAPRPRTAQDQRQGR
jgi:CHC2 zinc finger